MDEEKRIIDTERGMVDWSCKRQRRNNELSKLSELIFKGFTG